MSAFGYLNAYPCVDGPVLAPASQSQVTARNAENATYAFVSTTNSINANDSRYQYKFKSESERLQYKLGQLNVLGNRNLQTLR
jgi:hypothetical protein